MHFTKSSSRCYSIVCKHDCMSFVFIDKNYTVMSNFIFIFSFMLLTFNKKKSEVSHISLRNLYSADHYTKLPFWEFPLFPNFMPLESYRLSTAGVLFLSVRPNKFSRYITLKQMPSLTRSELLITIRVQNVGKITTKSKRDTHVSNSFMWILQMTF